MKSDSKHLLVSIACLSLLLKNNAAKNYNRSVIFRDFNGIELNLEIKDTYVLTYYICVALYFYDANVISNLISVVGRRYYVATVLPYNLQSNPMVLFNEIIIQFLHDCLDWYVVTAISTIRHGNIIRIEVFSM